MTSRPSRSPSCALLCGDPMACIADAELCEPARPVWRHPRRRCSRGRRPESSSSSPPGRGSDRRNTSTMHSCTSSRHCGRWNTVDEDSSGSSTRSEASDGSWSTSNPSSSSRRPGRYRNPSFGEILHRWCWRKSEDRRAATMTMTVTMCRTTRTEDRCRWWMRERGTVGWWRVPSRRRSSTIRRLDDVRRPEVTKSSRHRALVGRNLGPSRTGWWMANCKSMIYKTHANIKVKAWHVTRRYIRTVKCRVRHVTARNLWEALFWCFFCVRSILIQCDGCMPFTRICDSEISTKRLLLFILTWCRTFHRCKTRED